ncbi:MAG: GNAT family N-acetyltransferase [Terracoccus sp.]
MVRIQPVDPHDEDAFAQWYAVMRASATHGRTAPTVWAEATLTHWYRHPNPRRSRVALAAVDESRAPGARVVGVASVELPLDVDTETAEVDVEVLPTERGRGVGSALWEATLEVCRAERRTVLQAEVNVPVGVRDQSSPGLRFARDRGFTSENIEDHLALPLGGGLPSGTAAPDAGAGHRFISWVDRAPDDLVAAYAAMQTLMNADVPTGGLVRTPRPVEVADVRHAEERQAKGFRSLVTLALTTGGEPAGYTLVFVPKGDEDNLLQDDTYVIRSERGHRLGQRLKTANLAQVREVAPASRWLHTWTEQGNAPMHRTNRAFGFSKVETMHEVQLLLA